jgi:hypothetical protein
VNTTIWPPRIPILEVGGTMGVDDFALTAGHEEVSKPHIGWSHHHPGDTSPPMR